MDIEHARELWDAKPGWLNTATYGLPPRPAWEALQEALDTWRQGGTSWKDWDDSTRRSRSAFAQLIGVAAQDVAVGSTVSAMLGPFAAALPSGARVVVPDVEFTSNLFPWQVQAERGVEVVTVPTRELVDAVRPGTSVVAFSAVQSATGEVAPFDELCDAAQAVGALVVVDATQAVGWLPRTWSRADVVVVAAYKWLMAPKGAAFCYFAPAAVDRVPPIAAGWYAGQDPHASYYGPPLRLASDARRFDISPAWFCWVGAAPALELLLDVGVDRIHAHDVALANRFRAGVGLPPGDSAIVSVAIPGAEERLATAGVRTAVRDGRVRASFHIYTTEADVDLALDAFS